MVTSHQSFEVAIWDVALSDDEVQQAMDQVFAVEAVDKLPVFWADLKSDYTKQ